MKKIALSVLIVTMLIAPILMPVSAGVADVAGWYYNVNGVLSSDDFYAYPYNKYDLKLGYSRFGEKISAVPDPAVGLQYHGAVTALPSGGADPFANPGVSMNEWVEGWWLALTYQHRTLGWRTLWAWAMFSDFSDWGSPSAGDNTVVPARVTSGGWIRYKRTVGPGGLATEAAALEPHGGRKTNARVETADPIVLYNGPRKYMALISHTLYDQSIDVSGGSIIETGPNVEVLTFTILIEFNKVKKEVVQKKDVKLSLDDKTMVGDKAYLELRNSGQWDLGTTEHYRSYAHFYTTTEAPTTKYGAAYHMPNHEEFESTCQGYGIQWPGLGSQWGKYAKAQIISSVSPYVGWAAFWPHPSYWSVDGFQAPYAKWGYDLSTQWPGPWTDPQAFRANDLAAEPDIPFVGAEWDFIFHLGQNIKIFRGITTYGVTDQHDCDDTGANGKGTAYPTAGGAGNVIDKEVAYQNDEVFNPFDLYDAVHKDKVRWVDYFARPTSPTSTVKGWTSEPVVIVSDADWWKYCNAAEKVIDTATNTLKKRGTDYTFTAGAAGKAVVTWLTTEPVNWKILYSTDPDPAGARGAFEWITIGTISAPIDAAGAAMVSEAFDSWKDINVTKAGLDIWDSVNDPTEEVPYLFKVKSGGNPGTRTDYRDNLGRTRLLNDFCTSNPIKTSNIIHVGGPLVNYGTEFMNDFTPVLYGMSIPGTHVSTPDWAGKIVAAECWARNKYTGSGYAVVSVYKDIDGTVHLGIWGATGVDTYYASLWFWGAGLDFGTGYGFTRWKDADHDNAIDSGETEVIYDPGIKYLQTENLGVVSIILKFDYTKKYTSTSFVYLIERIGTISEKYPHDP